MSEDPLEHIQIKRVTSASLNDLIDLYKDAGWWEPAFQNDHEFLKKIVTRSAVFVGAFDRSRLIGMGRALSDLVSDAYIQDVIVLEQYRNQGIGAEIIKTLVHLLEEKGVDWIGLVAQPGTSSFYNHLGFEALEGHTPLRYKG